ncbi:CBS domain-containing protein [Streptomyces sp. NPDC048436]|uniref:CBS domain-containing protein n=1 Tax=Streptomyces sp. NPDC048436 TaxID=3365550 RepID=UPI003712CA51
MTPVQTQHRPADSATTTTVDAAGPQVRDDMTVELALSVMDGEGSGQLFLCDADDQCTGLITRERLIAVRDSPAYTDQIRLRDVLALSR